MAGKTYDASISTKEERGEPRFKHLKQMAISKQASSIFVDNTPFFETTLIWDICIFAYILYCSVECQINYRTHWSKYLFYNSLLKMKSS